MSATTPKVSRHGKRADGMVIVTFPCSEALKNECAALAEKDSRSLSAWLRLKLQDSVRRSRAARKA